MNERWPFLPGPPWCRAAAAAAVAADGAEGGLRRGGVRAKTTAATMMANPSAPTTHRGVDAHEHQSEPGDDADGPDGDPAARRRPSPAALHLRGELGVLGSKRLLHLLEHLLFVL